MYNIHSHYENIFNYINTIIADPIVIYLHPFGTTSTGNIETIINDRPYLRKGIRGPVFICYDQEPLDFNYNYELFNHIKNEFDGPYVLLNTEQDSDEKNKILKYFGFIDCYYFFHAFAAADWFRGYQYNSKMIPLEKRTIKKDFITFNRITSNHRVYRTLFVAELIKNDALANGHVSYSDVCPDTELHYADYLDNINQYQKIDVSEYKSLLSSTAMPLRIDTPMDSYIPNKSFVISAEDKTQESLFQVVTETMFWGRKKHLTEKIFKPVVSKNPFILLGCAHNLRYLKSYGFKTFDRWIDESYDDIEDDHIRLKAVVDVLKSLEGKDKKEMLLEMREVLNYNYDYFYSNDFVTLAWKELIGNLLSAIIQTGAPLKPQMP
jgi:hypothetical protein